MSEWERLKKLEELRPSQYGQSLEVMQVTSVGAVGTVVIAKDVVRWRGDTWDVRPWRVYLAPWQPRSDIGLGTPLRPVDYAGPTPWNDPPDNFSNMVSITTYARVQWGSGGITHTAYVDWPVRGLLFGVSGSSIQVDGVGQYIQPDGSASVETVRLPILAGSLAPEPGGGDSAAPATYTYRRQLRKREDAEWMFQIPPFARSFVPLLRANPVSSPQITIEVLDGPQGRVESSWFYSSQDLIPMEPFPVSQQGCDVRIAMTGAPAGTEVGCMFHLDL